MIRIRGVGLVAQDVVDRIIWPKAAGIYYEPHSTKVLDELRFQVGPPVKITRLSPPPLSNRSAKRRVIVDLPEPGRLVTYHISSISVGPQLEKQ